MQTHLDSVGPLLAVAFYLAELCQAVLQQSPSLDETIQLRLDRLPLEG